MENIAIGIPHIGDIRPYFFDTVLNLTRPPQCQIIRVDNKPVDIARNLIAATALADPEVTHLFFMDADMQFPAKALERLASRNLAIVGGMYHQRGGVPTPHAYHFHHEDAPDGTCPVGAEHQGRDHGRWYRPLAAEYAAYLRAHPEYAEEPATTVLPDTPDALARCDALATGCLLIRRDALQAVWDATGGRPFRCHEDTGGGEDFYFCEQALALGFEIWADLSVQCAHEFRYAWMDRSDFLAFADEAPTLDVIYDVAPQERALVVNPLVRQREAVAS